MKQVEVEIEITNSLTKLYQKEKNLHEFLNFTLLSYVISIYTTKNKEATNLIGSIDSSLIPDFKKYKNNLSESQRDFRDYLNEYVYKLHYQTFEEFIFDIFATLLNHFPEFLKKDNIDLGYELIFEQSDINIIRKNIIEKRVKNYIQSNNLKYWLQKFKTVFGINIRIQKQDIETLYLASRIRNLLTHNNGIVNHIFISELRKENIKTEYQIGNSLINNLKNE